MALVFAIKQFLDYGKDNRKASRIIGLIQSVASGFLFLVSAIVTIQLLTLGAEGKTQVKFVPRSQSSLLPPLNYDDILVFCCILSENFLVSCGFGILLVLGVREHRHKLLNFWSLHIIFAWIINCILISQFSPHLTILFSTLYLFLCMFPVRIVKSLERELKLCELRFRI